MVRGSSLAMATLLDLYYAVRAYVNTIANLPGAMVPPLTGIMARILIQSVGGPILESLIGQKAAAAPIQIQDCQEKASSIAARGAPSTLSRQMQNTRALRCCIHG